MARNFTNIADKLSFVSIQAAQAQAQTFSAWVLIDAITTSHFLFVIRTAGEPETNGIAFYIYGTDRNLQFYAFSSGTNLWRRTNVAQFSLSTLFHVLYTWDGGYTASNAHIYVNNSEVSGYLNTVNGTATFEACDGTWNVGSSLAENLGIDGKMSDVGWWNRVLTTAERTMLFKRYSPKFIPNGLKFAPDLIRGVGDPISGKVGSLTGTEVFPHPRIIQPCGIL